jgi:membrane protease YdiL (CAAX protease family)
VSQSISRAGLLAANVPRRTLLWIEVGIVATIFFLPALYGGLRGFLAHDFFAREFGWYAEGTRLVGTAEAVIPVLFIVWVSGDGLKHFGLISVVWWRFLPAMLLGLLANLVLTSAVGHLVYPHYHAHPGFRLPGMPPRMYALTGARILNYFPAAFAEEFIMRGYLIARLTELLGSRWVAWLVSSVLFGSYHIYQGVIPALTIFGAGLIFGLMVLKMKSVWPSTFAHALFNSLITLFNIP